MTMNRLMVNKELLNLLVTRKGQSVMKVDLSETGRVAS